MSKPMYDGGPAFPTQDCEEGLGTYTTHDGMTLRDYFAAKAMHALIAEMARCRNYGELPAGAPIGEVMGVSDATTDAYAIADAMLAAREA